MWILGNERTLASSPSVWEALVIDAKNRRCFYSADDDKDLAKTIVDVKKELDQFDDLLNADSILFKSSKWKVKFSLICYPLLKTYIINYICASTHKDVVRILI